MCAARGDAFAWPEMARPLQEERLDVSLLPGNMNESRCGGLVSSLSGSSNSAIALKIATLNIRGLTAKKRQAQVKRILIEGEIDILALQESKIESEEQADRMVNMFNANHDVCVCHAVGRSGGCILFLKRSSTIIVERVVTSDDGRLIILCDLSVFGEKWRIVCVYAPNVTSHRKCFFIM